MFISAVVLHYIGHGRRNTGDWCFQDGYITFTDLAQLYLQLLRGRVLTIVTDCSHSGSWVKQCMAFLDQQGVGPCGHSARDKRILIKVFSSCLSHQVPRQLAYSVYGSSNDKNTGDMTFTRTQDFVSPSSQLTDLQHCSSKDFTVVRCGQDSINEECLCLPQADWQQWSARKRTFTFLGRDGGRKAWHILLLKDREATVLQYLERSGYKNCDDYGEVLMSGWGEGPTKEDRESAMKDYQVYRTKADSAC